MKRKFIPTMTLMVLSTTATAQISVNGNRISWPDNGHYYQVQEQNSSYKSICDGTAYCDVVNGTYQVTNHTTGYRTHDIVIPEPGSIGVGSETFEIDGNIIRFPDNGHYYQVQEQNSSYRSVCDGERFCVVSPGTYQVTNFTTGLRTRDIVIRESDASSPVIVAGRSVIGHTMALETYLEQHEYWIGRGYLPTDIAVYLGDSGNQRYAAVWKEMAGPVRKVLTNLEAAEYQKQMKLLNSQGYRPIHISPYTGTDGKGRFAAIWEKSYGITWRARHNITAQQYLEEVRKANNDGLQVVQVSGYTDNGQTLFTVLFETISGMSVIAEHNLTTEQYAISHKQWKASGYQLTHVDGYERGGKQNYTAVWQNDGAAADWSDAYDMNTSSFQSAFTNATYMGREPSHISAFNVGDEVLFAAIWGDSALSLSDQNHIAKEVDAALKLINDDAVGAGLSIAIVRDERLIFAQGYNKNQDNHDFIFSPKHLFRIASVSKPVTSAGIMTLVERNLLSLDDNVFGPGGILGYSVPSCITWCLEDITVQHLLEHSAGAWANDGNDPMFLKPDFSQDDLIDWTLTNQPLLSAPGDVFRYSNFGYSLLGRVIEKITGTGYEAFMQSVLLKAGIKDMHIAGNTEADRRPNEVIYVNGPTIDDPYGPNVKRMDSHGGWIASAIDLAKFCVASDNFSTLPDLLTADSTRTMLTPTMATGPNQYAKGWWVNATGTIWWHNGSMLGTTSIIARYNNFCWAAVANTNDTAALFIALDQLPKRILWGAAMKPPSNAGVGSWPNYDLLAQ